MFVVKYVIIGGDAAGMSAAMQIVRNSSGNEIVTLEKGNTYSYAQCGLPYVIGKEVESTDRLIARTPETFRDKYSIDTKVKHEVTEVDPERKVVRGINHETGENFHYEYDRLLIATGASPIIPDWEGIEKQGVFPLKTIPDAHQIMDYMKKYSVKHATVIGGGYIGLEMAENFKNLGLDVRIIERANQLAVIFDEDMAEHIHEEAERQGIELVFEESVEGFSGKDHVEGVKTDWGTYPTDLALVAIGIRPNTGFLQGTGIELGVRGAIRVNAYMETSVKDHYAAGDCATQYHRVKKKDDYIPLGTNANKQGQIAGLNMVNQGKAFQGIVGTSVIKFFDLTLGRTGLSEKEASDLNIPYQTVKVQSNAVAQYYSKDEKMILKLLYHAKTRKILGGQIIGKSGIDKRVDVLATALYNGMTIDELTDLDLSYAPPYNSVWDPVQQAARKAKSYH